MEIFRPAGTTAPSFTPCRPNNGCNPLLLQSVGWEYAEPHFKATVGNRASATMTTKPIKPIAFRERNVPAIERQPILNASLPARFRQIRMELAREPAHPEGDPDIAYVFVAPVDADGRLDAKLWRSHREACRVARQRPEQQDQLGYLVHHPGGAWGFHYDGDSLASDDLGYHFADERFIAGEYVSINEPDGMHTYRVIAVSRL
jgi:hypothetical protein